MSDSGEPRLLPLTIDAPATEACGDDCCAAESDVTAPAGPSDRRRVLARRIRLLVAATITYNVVEARVAIGAGTGASSTALIGFGLDSVIEVASAAAVAWQFPPPTRTRGNGRRCGSSRCRSSPSPGTSASRRCGRSRRHRSEHSTVGLVLAAVSLAVMPVLSDAQRRAGRELGSAPPSPTPSRPCCARTCRGPAGRPRRERPFGWWWADPVAALVIAAVAVKEGREAWRGDACC